MHEDRRTEPAQTPSPDAPLAPAEPSNPESAPDSAGLPALPAASDFGFPDLYEEPRVRQATFNPEPLRLALVVHTFGFVLLLMLSRPLLYILPPVVFGVAMAQVTLAGIWLVEGRSPIFIRLIAVSALAFALALLLGGSGDGVPLLLLFSGCQILLQAAPLVALRVGGWRVDQAPLDSDQDVPRWRFRIHDLLLWTAEAALLLVVGRWVWDALEPRRLGPFFMILAVALSGSCWGSCWALLGRGYAGRRVALLFALIVVGGFLWGRSAPFEVLPHAAVVTATLAAARASGYRMAYLASDPCL